MLQHDAIFFRATGSQRIERIRVQIELKGYFTYSLSSADLSPRYLDFYFLGWNPDTVDAVALGVTRGASGTGSKQVRIERVVEIGEYKLSELLEPDLARAAELNGMQGLPKDSANLALQKIQSEHPDAFLEIEEIIQIVNGSFEFDETEPHIQKIAYQRDAVGLSLEIFGGGTIRRDTLNYALLGKAATATSFLDLIDDDYNFGDDFEYLQEDEMITHDLETFDGFEEFKKIGYKQKVLRHKNRELLITNANRNGLENCLGVDLIYANLNTKTYCFIQYKKMIKPGKSNNYVYYPKSDGNFSKELKLMKEFHKSINTPAPKKNYENYRAFKTAIFFKFCKSLEMKVVNPQMIDGIYLPIDMWPLYLKHLKEIDKAPSIRYGEPVRTFDKNTFVTLFRDGLIGTPVEAFGDIFKYINESLRNKRSVLAAFERTKE